MKKRFLSMVFLLFCTLGVWAQEAVQFGRFSVVPEQNVRAVRTRTESTSSLDLGLPVGGRVNVLMQFARIPSAKELVALEAQGVRLSDYVGGNAYFATVQPGRRPSDFRGLGAISVIPMRPEWKLSTPLVDGDVPPWARRGGDDVEVTLYWFGNANAAFARAYMEERGYRVGDVSDQLSAMTATLPLSAVREVAAEPWVQYVAPADPPQELYNYGGRLLGASTPATQSVDLGGRGLTGKGVRVGLWDGNVEPHVDYGDRIHILEFEMSVASTRGHGMHTCGTIMGAGVLNPKARGLAPKVELWAMNFNTQRNGLSVAEEMLQVHEKYNIALTSNSYGPQLKRLCRFYDQLTYSVFSAPLLSDMVSNICPSMSHFYAAGNEQGACGKFYGSNFSRSKNVIYVGAVNGSGNMSDFSSFGPMDDGRLLPTVSAKGVGVLSTVAANGYTSENGTSMACPTTAGLATLLTERYHQLHGNQHLNSALMKGLLANTADDRGNAGPDYQYGYGIVNLEAALTALEHEWYAEGVVTSGELALPHRINVPSGVKQLRVMLTWIDPAVVKEYPYGSPALINDLDLTVEVGGATVKPWVLDKEQPGNGATRGVDKINNIEQVTVDNPVAGEVVIRIGGQDKIAQGDNQKYVLTWYFDYEKPQLLHPIGGEVFSPDELLTIRANNCVGLTRAELSYDGGKTYTYLGGARNWYATSAFIPKDAPMTTNAILRLTDSEGNVVVSPHPFTIAPTPEKLKYEAAPCDPSSWKLEWNPANGAAKYAVLKADVPTGEWTEIAEVTDATYAIPEEHVTKGDRNVFAVAVKMDDGKLGPRSLGVLVAEPTAMTLTDDTLPFTETFVELPLRNAQIEAGENVAMQWAETPASLGLPLGSHLLFAKTNLKAGAKPFENKNNVLTIRHCVLDLTNVTASADKRILFSSINLMESPVSENEAQMRLLVDGMTVNTIQGENAFNATAQIRDMVWDISEFAGKKVKLELQFGSHLRGAQVIVIKYGVRVATKDPDVGVFLSKKVVRKANMEDEELQLTVNSSSVAEIPTVPLVVSCDGKVVATQLVKDLKPFEGRMVTIPVNFHTDVPEGHIFKVEVAASLEGDVYLKDNTASFDVYNMGDVFALPPVKLESFFGMQFPIDPKVVKKVDKPILFTDDGGTLQSYGLQNQSSVKFVPADPTMTICMTVRECKLGETHTFSIYTNGLAKDFEYKGETPAYTFTEEEGGTPRMFISKAKDGSITIQFFSYTGSEAGDGWIAEVRQIARTNSLTLLPLEVEDNYPTGKAQVKVKVKNLTPVEKKEVDGILTTSQSSKPINFVIPSIPESDEIEYTIPNELDVPYPSRAKVTVTINGMDADGTDNTQSAVIWNDKFWKGGTIADEEKYGIQNIMVPPAEAEVESYGNRVDYELSHELPLYIGTVNPLFVSLTAEPKEDDLPASIHVWIDIDETDNELKNVAPEYYTIPLVKEEAEYQIPIDLTSVAGVKAGKRRMRVALLPGEKDKFIGGDKAPWGRVVDIVADVREGTNPLAHDVEVRFKSNIASGLNLPADQKISAWIINNGHEKIKDIELQLLVNGVVMATEKVSDEIPPYDGNWASFEFPTTIDLSTPGLYSIELKLTADDGNLDNNVASQHVVCYQPPATDKLYALSMTGAGNEFISVPAVPGDAQKVTMEGWFMLNKSHYGTLFESDGIYVTTTYKMKGDIPDNGILVLVGRDMLAYSGPDVLMPGEFHHIAVVVNTTINWILATSELHVYIDGKEVAMTIDGGDGGSYSEFEVGRKFDGLIKMFRFWKKCLPQQTISDNMTKSVRDADGSLPSICAVEYMMNEGKHEYLLSPTSGALTVANIRSERVDVADKNIWVPLDNPINGVLFKGQLLPSRVEDDGTITFIMPHDFTDLANVTGKILAYWPGTEITYKGAPVTADTKFDFSGDNTITIAASLEIFGMHLKEDAVKIRLITDKNPGTKITKLDLLTADNANLKADVSFTEDTQTIVLRPEDKSATEKLDLTKLQVTFTGLSEGAKVLYAGKSIVQGEKLELDLTQPVSVRVVAENGRDFTFYTIQVEMAQTITWDADPLTLAYTNETMAVPASTSSGNPVVYRSKDAHVAVVDAQGNLHTAGVGKTTLYATAPADGLYAAATQVSRDVTVTPAGLTIEPVPMAIEEGEAVPEISLQYTGLLFDEVTSQFKQPTYQVYKDNSTVWTPDLGPLTAGEYDVKAAGYTDPYADGNYMVTLLDGKLSVKPATKAKSVNFTVTDGSTAIDKAEIKIAGIKLTTDAAGNASIKLLPGKYSYSASMTGYQAVSGEVTVKDTEVNVPVALPKLEVTLTYKVKNPAQGSIAGKAKQMLPKNVEGSKVTAVPAIGFAFKEWEEDNKAEATRSDKSDADKTFTAIFKPVTYTLTYKVGEGGEWVSGDQNQNITPGQDGAEVEVRANTGYVFLGWSDGVQSLKRQDKEVKGDIEVTAQFYKFFTLPLTENFDLAEGMPYAWTVDNLSTKGGYVWAVGTLNGAFDASHGRFAFISSEAAGLGHKHNTNLMTPWIKIDAATPGIQVVFDLDFKNFGKSDWVVFEYSFDGTKWNELKRYKKSTQKKEKKQELEIEADALAGKTQIQFRWNYTAAWAYHAAVDNIAISVKGAEQVIEYIAGKHGTLTGAIQGAGKQTIKVTTPKGKPGELVTAVPGAGYLFDRWSDNKIDAGRQDSENGRYIAYFKPAPKPIHKVVYTADNLGKIVGFDYQEVEDGSDAQPVEAVALNGKDKFVEWNDHRTDNPRVDKNVTADVSYKATFAPRFLVTYGVKGSGGTLEATMTGGQPLGDGKVDPNTEVTFTATPEDGYEVAGWSGVTATPANATTATLTVTADAVVQVAFKPIEATLTFLVVKKGTPDPLQGAEVKLENNAPKYTDGEGKVHFANLRYGTYSYTIKLSGAQTIKRTVQVNAPAVEETVEMEWNGAKATFTVTDGTNPIKDAVVQIAQQQTKTDEHGKAVLSLDKKKYNFKVMKADYTTVDGEIDLTDGDKEVAVTLEKTVVPPAPTTATATFMVTADGNPLEGATVTIEGKTATTDAEGKATIAELERTAHDYTVTKEGYNDAKGSVDLTDGDKEVAVTLEKTVVPPAPTTATATFMVTADGKPLQGATVTIAGKSATTDAEGKAAIAELERKAYDYVVTKKGYNDAKGSVDLTEGDKMVNVALKAVEKPQPKPTAVESALLANVVVAPNPFVETLHLTGVESLRTIQVFTVDGVLVLNHTHDGASEAIFQADSWKSGIYILRLIDLEGAVKQLRVVKQQ